MSGDDSSGANLRPCFGPREQRRDSEQAQGVALLRFRAGMLRASLLNSGRRSSIVSPPFEPTSKSLIQRMARRPKKRSIFEKLVGGVRVATQGKGRDKWATATTTFLFGEPQVADTSTSTHTRKCYLSLNVAGAGHPGKGSALDLPYWARQAKGRGFETSPFCFASQPLSERANAGMCRAGANPDAGFAQQVRSLHNFSPLAACYRLLNWSADSDCTQDKANRPYCFHWLLVLQYHSHYCYRVYSTIFIADLPKACGGCLVLEVLHAYTSYPPPALNLDRPVRVPLAMLNSPSVANRSIRSH